MWIVVAFDVPSETADNRREYRFLRKKLMESGFIPWQKSLFSYWVESGKKAEIVIRKITSAFPQNGEISIFKIPDNILKKALFLKDRKTNPVPEPPCSWVIF